MLSLEEKIIDATTADGQKALKEFEDGERARMAAEKADEKAGDPE